MAGIYIHIPFCKQACHYCDFHFSTSLRKKDEMLDALVREITLRKSELQEPVETIYFGGGTPSLLSRADIDRMLNAIYSHFKVESGAEITLEANPDDIDFEALLGWSKSGINRVSLGIQSFRDDDLRYMNRAHDGSEANRSLELVCSRFDNVSVDLIYAVPGMTDAAWMANLDRVFEFPVRHLSSYSLTVEPKTALAHFIQTGKSESPSAERARVQFELLVKRAGEAGLIQYEVSNFAVRGYESRHNSSYWKGASYLGIGPSAHSYDGRSRGWNASNNAIYRKRINAGQLAIEIEELSDADRFNELILTGLRTVWGVSLKKLKEDFGTHVVDDMMKRAQKYVQRDLLKVDSEMLSATPEGFFLIDGITADLFTE